MWCFNGVTPVSIEVCEGRVMLGMVVCAVQVSAPSAAMALRTGMSLWAMTAGFPPSKLMMKTWSARGVVALARAVSRLASRQGMKKRGGLNMIF